MKSIGIYIHVPFCKNKCPYCSFYSVSAHEFKMEQYKNQVIKELQKWGKKLKFKNVDTIYFGGGTPSLLCVSNIEEIIKAAKNNFKVKDGAEITMEINPTTVGQINFSRLLTRGVNRLSIGLQSANGTELKLLGRQHTAKMAKDTVKMAQVVGFSNISLDLMLAVPKQTTKTLVESIKFCKNLGVQHVSTYLLKIEKGTPFFKKQSSLNLLNDDSQADFYLTSCNELEKAGFFQYEISNFSLPGYESRHNLKYWNGDEYLGIGPGAHSFLDKKRFFYKDSLDDFLKNPTTETEGAGGDEEEYSMLRLRLTDGLKNYLYYEKFNKNIPESFFKKAKLYEKSGLTLVDDKSIKLTKSGFLVSNELISQIIL